MKREPVLVSWHTTPTNVFDDSVFDEGCPALAWLPEGAGVVVAFFDASQPASTSTASAAESTGLRPTR